MIGRLLRNSPTERDLAALADGSLAPQRRKRVERAVAASPALQAQLRDQRYALDAIRAVESARAPAALRARVALARPSRPQRRRIGAFAVPAAAAVAAALVVALGGGEAAAPSVADAAALAARPAVMGAPAVAPGSSTLSAPSAAGLRFPYWADRFGWKAIGSRHDHLDGRSATTVFYRQRGEVVGYTIIGGAPLPVGAKARSTTRDGTALRSLTVDGRHAVTWLRRGHTCVLSGARMSSSALLRLASWHGGGGFRSDAQ